MDHQQFIDAILEDPHDLQARLVFADFLEESGDPRAELIRVQLEQQGRLLHDPERKRLRAKELKLLKQYGKFGSLPDVAKELSACGGFPDAMEITVQRFLNHADEIFASAPIRQVVFRGQSKKIDLLAESPYLKNLASLTLKNHDSAPAKFQKLLTNPCLTNLDSLDISGDWITPEILQTVATHPNFVGLKSLEVALYSFGNESDENDLSFLTNPCFENLESLAINGFAAHDVTPISNSPKLTHLTQLQIEGGGLLPSIMHEVLDSSSYPNLRSLRLNRGYYLYEVHETEDPIPEESRFPELVELEIVGSYGSQLIPPIVRNYPKLEVLRLSSNKVGDDGLESLIHSDLFSNLRALYLTNNEISPKGAETLGDMKPKKLKVHLDGNPIGRRDTERLRKKFGKSFLSLNHFFM